MNDPRLTPARGDLAAAHLRGQVEADRFVDGVAHQVQYGVSALRETPSHMERLETQLLHGEIFTVYDLRDGWAWGQCALDGYVGYAHAEDLTAEIVAPTHRVTALRAIQFPFPDLKSQPHAYLSCNAKIAIVESNAAFSRSARGGWVPNAHLAPLEARVGDWAASAERLIGAPYLWGGKDSFGVDCSGLIQSALETAGIHAPRDADMQEAALGREVEFDPRALARGDLLFWEGHVGIMRDATHLLHANGFHMQTAIEPLRDTIARIGTPRCLKRL